jgi:Leucine-rich repeat (LRR) protein
VGGAHARERRPRQPRHALSDPLGIERLPESIATLRSLVHLDLRVNRLTEVPAALAELPELRILDLRWNGFTEVPPALRPLAERGCLIRV